MIKNVLDFLILYKELLAILLSPIIAVSVGEYLRIRNYKKRQKEDLIRRLLSYGHQLTPQSDFKNEILSSLNEIKYWYSSNTVIGKLNFTVMGKMGKGEDVQKEFIELMQKIGLKEGHKLSKDDIEKVFTFKK